ncbi:MAG: hypothetical protein RLZZ261_579 [Bacteroidota bacterium]
MYTGLLHSHRSLAYLFLLAALTTVVLALINRLQNKPTSKALNGLTLATLILGHLQLLFGLGLYFVGPWFGMLTENTGEVMRNADLRLFAVEHILVNIIGIALVTVGRSRFKKLDVDRRKQQAVIAYVGLGLLLIASRVPWERLF